MKLESSRSPIEVLITPEGRILSTSLDDRDFKPSEVLPKSEDQVEGGKSAIPSENQSAATDDISSNTNDSRCTQKATVRHWGNKARRKCRVCQKEFNRKDTYDEHMQRHTGKYRFLCDICQKGFTTRRQYNDHMMKHEGKSYSCQKCEKSFTTMANLKRHIT